MGTGSDSLPPVLVGGDADSTGGNSLGDADNVR